MKYCWVLERKLIYFSECDVTYSQIWWPILSSGQPFMLRGFGAFLKGTSVVVLRVERVLYNPCQPETRTRNLWITSPTLQATTSPTTSILYQTSHHLTLKLLFWIIQLHSFLFFKAYYWGKCSEQSEAKRLSSKGEGWPERRIEDCAGHVEILSGK